MRDWVIVLHGLARTKHSMRKLTAYLEKKQYQVLNLGYSSTKFKIESLAESILPEAVRQCQAHHPNSIHFVTHSMGGILVRYYLSRFSFPELGRVVMLSPPNQGSELVDKLGHLWLFKFINGPAGNQLGTGRNSLPCRLKSVDYEAGIITGDKPLSPLTSLLFPGDNDGKVSVERAKLRGMKDFCVVNKSHSFIMESTIVCQQTAYFLKHGRFLNNGC